MTKTPQPASDQSIENTKSGSKFWIDMGPIIIFVVTYQIMQRNGVEDAVIKAGGIFMIAAFAALAYSRVKLGKFSGLLVFTTIIIGVTVGLSFIFRNPVFIYIKPTVVNAVYGVLAIGSVFAKKNFAKVLLGEAITLPEDAWNTLAVRWGLFFFASAILNEVIWRNFSEEFWVNFKLLGFLPITLLFTFSQLPFILKHQQTNETESAP